MINILDNEELNIIYREDQQDRKDKLWEKDEKLMRERDNFRLGRVMQLIENGEIKTPSDHLHAAMILQHGPTTKFYDMAHELCRKVVNSLYVRKSDEVDPFWLMAATKDRSLMSQGKLQLYGTQIRKDVKDGLWYVYPVDAKITDKERAELHVPPISEAYKRAADLNEEKN
jgi:hypothetical protein